VGVVVVVTKKITHCTPADASESATSLGMGLMAAAMSLQIMATCEVALADSAPERGVVAFKYLDYLDRQPGSDRIRVKAPSLLVMKPLSNEWSMSSTYTTDTISGASPAYHTQALRNMHDQRHMIEVSGTHYDALGTQIYGGSFSKEADYLSKGIFYAFTKSSEDKNTTWNAGVSTNSDQINPTNHIVANETKQTLDFIVGVTQVMGVRDIAQVQVGHFYGQGYFSDPYKVFDLRPKTRTHNTLMGKWNHHFESRQTTLKMSYRYYDDNWGIQSHTLNLEYVKPYANQWAVMPYFRLYTQSAARFFVNSDGSGSPFPPSPSLDAVYYTEDQRMSAFGAHTYGLKVSKLINQETTVDLKVEQYQQRAGWRLFGEGSPGLDPFTAKSIQFGVSHLFD
jgi:Protein of unknown function (DUF3570)